MIIIIDNSFKKERMEYIVNKRWNIRREKKWFLSLLWPCTSIGNRFVITSLINTCTGRFVQ